eukprot:319951_1
MAPHLRLKQYLCMIYCAIIWLVYGTISVYSIIRFWKSRHNIILSKRHMEVTICLLSCALSVLILFIPLNLMAFANSNQFLNLNPLKWRNYGIYTIYPTIILLLQTLYVFIWRQWLHYLDANFMKQAEINRRWRQFISNSKWYLTTSNRKKFGRTSFLFYKIMLLLFIITTVSLCIWPLYHSSSIHRDLNSMTSITDFTSSMAATATWLVLSLILLIIIQCKTPKFTDVFVMRKE